MHPHYFELADSKVQQLDSMNEGNVGIGNQ